METSSVVTALAALAQETRLNVYRLLVEHAPEGLPAGQIAEQLGVPASSLSFHLKELTYAGLISPKQDGRFLWYRADLDAMNGLVGYLTENCCRSSAVCDPKCLPAKVTKPVAVRMPVSRKRKSA
jgi:ArsR family transcriptional regulator, arsenate/arsenite/antimonite-responsive transcriptional repressor